MRPEILLRLEAVGLSVRGRALIDGVSLELAAGEIVTLIGPNGAGKSTLVQVALGLLAPGRGRVWRKPGARIGYMPQRIVVADTLPLTVERFVTLGVPAPRARVRATLAETGAAHVLDSPVQAVSGGEMQRVLLARAMLREPELLVLDEPVQAVDVGGQYELYDLIGEIRHRHGCGILMVSHDLHLVMAATDRVVCLNRHVCCSGTPDSVSRDPAYRALFGLEGAAHVALYHHHHDHRHDAHGDVLPSAADAPLCAHEHHHAAEPPSHR